MKTVMRIVLASVAILVVANGCVKENQIPVNEGVNQKVTIFASIPDEGMETKVALSQVGIKTAVKLAWEAADVITVNSETFSIVKISADGKTAEFTGDDPGAGPYDIVYSNISDVVAQTQSEDGNLEHLKYAAAIEDADTYENLSFSSTWAGAHGGTFTSSSVLELRAKLPASIASSVRKVIFTFPENITVDNKRITVSLTTPGVQGVDNILDVYATLPDGNINLPNILVQFQVSDKAYEKYSAYREFASSNVIAAGTTQYLGIDCSKIESYANASSTNIGESTNPYLVGDQNQMVLMKNEMESGKTKYFKVVDDIDLTGKTWVPLNYADPYDKGIYFDGGGHKISNLSAGSSTGYPSFAGVVYGTIKNVTFDKCSITGGSNNAGVVGGYIGSGEKHGECVGVTVSNSSVTVTATADNRNAGMFAGVLGTAGSSIINCHVTGTNTVTQNTTSNTGCSAAGFIGRVDYAAAITNCTATANVHNTSSYYTGGFAGQVTAAATITNCAFLGGTLRSERSNNNSPVAGFVGYVSNVAASFTNCHVSSAVIDATVCGRSGGFAGQIGNGSTLTSCYVENSSVSGAINTGGFAGVFYNSVANKCYVEGTTVTANANQTAGFIGYPQNSTVTNCFVSSSVTVAGGSYTAVGGFFGALQNGVSTSQCYEAANITGSSASTGSFIGLVGKVPTSITKNIAWNGTRAFVGSDGGKDISTTITGNYAGTEGTITSQALALNWDSDIWDFSTDIPTLK